MRIYIELKVYDDIVQGLIHQGNRTTGHALSGPALGPEATVSIRTRKLALSDLVSMLITYNQAALREFFDERGQLAVGQHLYAQTFGRLPKQLQAQLQEADAVDVRIITSDEHLLRLPWPLLADRGIFLCTKNWAVSLASDSSLVECELPPSPRILVAAPQPGSLVSTRADQHLEELEELLSTRDPLLTWVRNLRRVHTWAEFTAAVEEFQPHILYYYGHGVGGEDRTRLLFAEAAGATQEVPVGDLALCLRNMSKPPLIVYANCCLGDAAGFLGAGRQLEDFVPVVLTNRTVATIQAAQAQAMAFWESVLLRGVEPHLATATLYGRLTTLGLSTADVRWLAPVLHCHYSSWRANPPMAPSRQIHDPHWHLKIDRVKQYAVVAEQIRQMLRERKPRSHAFIWYGRPGEGIEIFHQRLNMELRESLFRTHLYEVRPEWPVEFENFHRSCADMFLEAFGVSTLADIPARVRSETAGAIGTQTLVYVRHTPILSGKKVLNAARLQRYLQWWDSVLVPVLERQQHALLGISFEVNNPLNFLTEMAPLEDMNLQNTGVRVLDEMESLNLRDLRDFLRTHNIQVDPALRDKTLTEILAHTKGKYELTVEALKNVVEELWNLEFNENDSTASNGAADDLKFNQGDFVDLDKSARSTITGRDVIGSLLNTADHNQVFVADYERLQDAYLNPSSVFDRLNLEHFTGREWLLAEVDGFLHTYNRGYFILEADAGLGKTAFMAWLAKQRHYIHHFSELAPGQEGVGVTLRNLAAQLALAYGLRPEGVLPSAASRPDYLYDLLKHAANQRRQDEKIVLIVDALDEAGTPFNQNVLGLPVVLPEGVYILVSQRPVAVELGVQTSSTPRYRLTFNATDPNNQTDIQRFLDHAAKWPGVMRALQENHYTEEQFISTLLDKCRGVWIYLHYVIHEIVRGERSPLSLGTLPNGMTQYYASYWQRWRNADETAWDEVYLPILTTLAATQEPLSCQRLIEWSGAKTTERSLRRLLEARWRPFLAIEKLEDQTHYHFYHPTLDMFFNGQVETEMLSMAEMELINELTERTRARRQYIVEHNLLDIVPIEIVQGNLLERNVDTIVVPASVNNLANGTTISRQIIERLGNAFAATLLSKQNSFRIGQAMAFDAGPLPAKYLIYTATERSSLRTTPIVIRSIRAALEIAETLEDVETIAFPCMTMELSVHSLKELALKVLKEVQNYLAEGSRLKQVIFTFINASEYQSYLQAYQDLLAGVVIPAHDVVLSHYHVSHMMTPNQQIAVGQHCYLQVALASADTADDTSVILPSNLQELYCFISIEGMHIHGSEVLSIVFDPATSLPHPITFEFQALLRGTRRYTVELFIEDPETGRVTVYQTEGQVIIVAPTVEGEYSAILPALDFRLVSRPDLTLRVATEMVTEDLTQRRLHYYLTCRKFGIELVNRKVGECVLRQTDLDHIHSMLCEILQSLKLQPNTASRERLLSLGQNLYNLLFPTDSAPEFRVIYNRLADQISTWLILEDGVTWLPWELLAPSQYDTTDPTNPTHFLGERYRLSRWIEGLGPPLYHEVPFGEVALTHYIPDNRVSPNLNETLSSWRHLLAASSTNSISPVVKTDTPFYGLHILRHGDQVKRHLDIVSLHQEVTDDAHTPETEARQGRLDLRLKRPLVTMSMLQVDESIMEIQFSRSAWELSERVLPFLRAGASAVIASWWPTCEAADRIFWTTMYDLLEQRTSLGEAVWRARLTIQRIFPHCPDWLAYVLFGDPLAQVYWPEPSGGYTALECLNPDEPLYAGTTYHFRASIQSRPPVWYQERLLQTEELPDQMLTLFSAPGLLPADNEVVPMHPAGRTMRQAIISLTPQRAGTYPLVAEILEDEKHLDTLQLILYVTERNNSATDGDHPDA